MTDSRRRLLSLLLALGALLAALGAIAVISQRQMRLRGALDGLPGPELPARVSILGVNADLTQYDPAALDENLDLIAETGFAWVRQPFRWAEIEPTPGDYDWAATDAIVEAATARNLQLVAVLIDSPAWAADSATAPPADPAAFADFAGALAARYGDQIDVYQVWDEPNLSAGWGGRQPDPVAYAALLEAAYGAIHAADGSATVLTAGLAPTIEAGPENLSDVLYLRALYENGAAEVFDGVAGKPYGFDSGPDDRRVHANRLNFSHLILLREEMVRHGDTSKPLWGTSFGWNALPADWEGDESVWGQTTGDQQAAWVLDAYQRALTEWPWSGALIVEAWQGPLDDPTDARWGFALRGADGALSPTAQSLAEAAPRINGALWPGFYPPTTPLAEYSGEWAFSELGADFSPQNDSTVDLPFAGSRLGVTVRRGNYRAYLYVTVDGEAPDALPTDERGAYIVLTSPDYQPAVEMLPLADGLDADTIHEAHIEAERGWDQWALIGYSVGSDVDATGYDLAALALILATLGLAIAAVRAGRGLPWQRLATEGASRIAARLGEAGHLALSLISALAVWAGAALTWGGLVPDLTRRMGEAPSLLLTALSAGVFYYSPWLLLTLLALAVLFVLIYARPAAGLALIMFFTPYILLPRPLFDRAFSMVEVLSLLTLAAWGLRTLAGWRETGWPRPRDLWRAMTSLDKAVAAFVALSALSLAWSELLGVAVTELRQMVLEPVVMYLVLRTTPLTRRERWHIVDALIAAGAIVSLIGLYQVAAGVGVIAAEGGELRLKSVFGTPNNAALYLGRLVPIGAAVAAIGGTKLRRWLYGIAAGLMALATVLTLSKGGILLALPAGLAVVVVLWLGRPGAIAVAAGAALEALALIPLSRIPRFSGLFDFSSGTSTSFFRIQLWQSTLRLLRDHPITGVGLDQFLYQYRGRYILPAAWQQPDLSQPHNVWLNYWVRLGILGPIVGAWLQVAFWRMGLAAQRRLRESDPAMRALVVGLLGAMAAFLAHGLVDAVHFVIDLAFIYFMSLGLMHQIAHEAAGGD